MNHIYGDHPPGTPPILGILGFPPLRMERPASRGYVLFARCPEMERWKRDDAQDHPHFFL